MYTQGYIRVHMQHHVYNSTCTTSFKQQIGNTIYTTPYVYVNMCSLSNAQQNTDHFIDMRPYIQPYIYNGLYTTLLMQPHIYNIYNNTYLQQHLYNALATTPSIQPHVCNIMYPPTDIEYSIYTPTHIQ